MINRRYIVFIFTFLAPLSLHCTREGWSMVKPEVKDSVGFGQTLLGVIDFSFLAFYSLGLYVAGYLGDKMPIKKVLLVGMIVSSIAMGGIGLLGFGGVKWVWCYVIVFAINGLGQSVVWPGTVAIMGYWYPKSTRGKAMGIWSSSTSIGNIVGAQIANIILEILDLPWELVLITTGSLVAISGILIFFFVDEKPESLELQLTLSNSSQKSITFWQAWFLPGVFQYALIFAFMKLVNYGFLFWLPYYLDEVINVDEDYKGHLATLYDVGAITGSFTIGYVTDRLNMRAIVVGPVVCIALPMILIFRFLAAESIVLFFFMTCLVGMMVGSTCNIISSAISADLGQSLSHGGNEDVMATVTGIIDGTGSVGAALGQLLIGWVSLYSWDYVFYIFIGSVFIAALMLSPIVFREMKRRKVDLEEKLKNDGD